MAPLVLSVLWVRRAARVMAPLACALALGGVVVLDAQSPLPVPYAVTAAAVLMVLLCVRGRTRVRVIDGTLLGDLELGALLVVAATGAAEHVDASLDGRAFPAVYVAIGLVSAFARPAASIAALVFAAALE